MEADPASLSGAILVLPNVPPSKRAGIPGCKPWLTSCSSFILSER